MLASCDAASAVDVRHLVRVYGACTPVSRVLKVLLVMLMSAGPGTCNWKRAVDVMAEKRADCVIMSLLHRYCQKSQHQHQQLGLIAFYTISSFFIDAPKRLLRNFIEEGGVSLLSGTVKFLTGDGAASVESVDSCPVSAMDVFKILWGLIVNVTCAPDFDAILSSSSYGGREFHVVDSNSDVDDHLIQQRFINQELLHVRGARIRVSDVSCITLTPLFCLNSGSFAFGDCV